jgi:hypothetical protein
MAKLKPQDLRNFHADLQGGKLPICESARILPDAACQICCRMGSPLIHPAEGDFLRKEQEKGRISAEVHVGRYLITNCFEAGEGCRLVRKSVKTAFCAIFPFMSANFTSVDKPAQFFDRENLHCIATNTPTDIKDERKALFRALLRKAGTTLYQS